MSIVPDAEQRQESVRRFLADTSPPARLRRVMDSAAGYDRAGWDRLADELGLAGDVRPHRYQAFRPRRCLDMTVAYAADRVQFGRPIGSFQAVKHRCVDMLVDVESARSVAYHAAWTASAAPAELPVAWEHDAHLYYRRAHSSAVFLGDAAYHRELLAQRIGL